MSKQLLIFAGAMLALLASCGDDKGTDNPGTQRPAGCDVPTLSKLCLEGTWVLNYDAMVVQEPTAPLPGLTGNVITLTIKIADETRDDPRAPEKFDLVHVTPSDSTFHNNAEWYVDFGDATLVLNFSAGFGTHPLSGAPSRFVPARLDGNFLKLGQAPGTAISNQFTPGVPFEEWYEFQN